MHCVYPAALDPPWVFWYKKQPFTLQPLKNEAYNYSPIDFNMKSQFPTLVLQKKLLFKVLLLFPQHLYFPFIASVALIITCPMSVSP